MNKMPTQITIPAPEVVKVREGDGKVLTVVSPKGGTGKTVIAASIAYLLLKSNERVLIIDADFSTRGLSLFTLGSILQTSDFYVRKEQCLAEYVLSDEYPEEVTPRLINRYGIEYHMILSNESLWSSGIPDTKILSSGELDPESFLQRFRDLLEYFKYKYDYIVIDTRGGYDLTSAVPAVLSDSYVVVVEADKVSLEQVSGFEKALDLFAKEHAISTIWRGFVVNKASFDPSRTGFAEELASRFGGKTYGIIPADIECIRAYEVKDLPIVRFPHSDFTYWCAQMVQNLIAPQANWEDREHVLLFENTFQQLRAEWLTKKRVDRFLSILPFAQLLPILLGLIFYALYRIEPSSVLLYASYASVALFIIWSMVGSTFSGLQYLQWREVSKGKRVFFVSVAGYIILGLMALMVADVPRKIFTISLPPLSVVMSEQVTSGVEDLGKALEDIVDAWRSFALAALDAYSNEIYTWAEARVREWDSIPADKALPADASRRVASLVGQITVGVHDRIDEAAKDIKKEVSDKKDSIIGISNAITKIIKQPRASVDYRMNLLKDAMQKVRPFPSINETLKEVQDRILQTTKEPIKNP
jgi:cellulose biosynthesis protein BcsQ